MNGNTLIIDLPDEIALPLLSMPDAARQNFAIAALASALAEPATLQARDDAEADSWWANLTKEERAEEHRIVEESSAAGDSGQIIAADLVFARFRSKT